MSSKEKSCGNPKCKSDQKAFDFPCVGCKREFYCSHKCRTDHKQEHVKTCITIEKRTCATCGKKGVIAKCSLCTTFYCDARCQRRDWINSHQDKCPGQLKKARDAFQKSSGNQVKTLVYGINSDAFYEALAFIISKLDCILKEFSIKGDQSKTFVTVKKELEFISINFSDGKKENEFVMLFEGFDPRGISFAAVLNLPKIFSFNEDYNLPVSKLNIKKYVSAAEGILQTNIENSVKVLYSKDIFCNEFNSFYSEKEK